MTKNKFANTDISVEEFEKDFVDFLENRIQHINIAEEELAKGFPVSYEDEKGRWIREYPNGKKFLLGYDAKSKKTIETEIKA